MLIAMLTGDGLMDFDDPVHKHVPYFRLSDPLADQNATIRDMLCHRTGLSRHDLLWYKSPLEPEEVIRRIGQVKPTTSFRSTWEYANIPFLTAGTAAANADKRTLAESLKARIFDPLGMKTASGSAADFLKANNRAIGYRKEGDKLERITPLIYDSRGAGDISASLPRPRPMAPLSTRRRRLQRQTPRPRQALPRHPCAPHGRQADRAPTRTTIRTSISSVTGWAGSSRTTADNTWCLTAVRSPAFAPRRCSSPRPNWGSSS